MAVKKCLKCGAVIPDGAEFCPGCGAPKGAKAITQPAAQPAQPAQSAKSAQPTQPAQPQQPVYQQQQMMVKQGDPLKNLAQTLFSTKLMVIFILIGILIIFIGMLIWTFTYPDADSSDPDWGLIKPSAIITYIGFFIVAGVALIGGMINDKLNSYVRLGLIILGAWILAALLSGIDPSGYVPWGYYSGGSDYNPFDYIS